MDDLISKMTKIDEEAEKRAEEQEKRWMESQDKREKERMEHEDRQTQMMMSMFSSFMTQMSGMMMSQTPGPMPPYPPGYPLYSPTSNSMFTAQDYVPSYNSVPYSSSSCHAKSGSVDADSEPDPK